MDSAREDLLDELLNGTTGLAAMDGLGSPYDYKFAERHRGAASTDLRPAVMQHAAGEPKTRQETAQRMIRDLQVFYLVEFDHTDLDSNAETVANAIAAEMKYALIGSATQKHGGRCLLSFFQDMDFIGLDPQTENTHVMMLEFRFIYTYTRDVP